MTSARDRRGPRRWTGRARPRFLVEQLAHCLPSVVLQRRSAVPDSAGTRSCPPRPTGRRRGPAAARRSTSHRPRGAGDDPDLLPVRVLAGELLGARRVVGICPSAPGGSTSRSTTAAQPVTPARPGDRLSTSSRGCSGASWSCSTGVSEPCAADCRGPSPRPAPARSATRRAVSTRANSRAGWSQPPAAMCDSISSTAAASAGSTSRPRSRSASSPEVILARPRSRQVGVGVRPGLDGGHGVVHGVGPHQPHVAVRRPAPRRSCRAGTMNSSAPASRAPAIFCWMPPIGPTLPAPSMLPVPATMRRRSASRG